MHVPVPLLALLLTAITPTLAGKERSQGHGLHPCVHKCNAFGNGDMSQEHACITCWHYGKETIDDECKMCAFRCAKKKEARPNEEWCNKCLTLGANPADW